MRRVAAIALALALVPVTAWAGLEERIDWQSVDLAAERAAIEKYQRFDQRLQDVGWKMVRGNAPFCDRVIPSIGLQLQDVKSYGAPEIARAALGLAGDFAVQTSAAGSPAARAWLEAGEGALTPNREILRIGAEALNQWEAGERLHWQRLTRAHDHLDAALVRNGQVRIEPAEGAPVTVEPVEVCASRFELMGEGKRAVADGDRVVIGIGFPGFAYEEEIFAGVVAHELAHNFLRHSEWLDRNGRKRRNVRKTEREADRLMPWLLANAGYDPRAALEFMQTWGPRHDGGLLRDRSHDGWDERADFIAAELPRVEALMREEGQADWRTHFRRGIDPRAGLGAQAAK